MTEEENGLAGENGEKGKFSSAVLFPFPVQLDGVSLQGAFLYQGLKENGYPSIPCSKIAPFEKRSVFKIFEPDVAIGVGFWGDTPDIVSDLLKYNVTPVPWFNADGWIANYHDILNDLPLIMVTSNWVKETYIRDGVHNKNMYSVPIGIDTKNMSPIPKEDPRVIKMRELLGVKPDEKLILTIGGDTTSKGFQEVLKALASVNEQFDNWKYIGKSWEAKEPEYHYREEQEIIKSYNLPKKKISYLDGPLSREMMQILLNSADIYAAPSRIEGFGMIQVEAQCCGIPVLGIDAMGIKDTIVHGETGLLAKVGETVDLEQEWASREMGFKKKQIIKFDKPKTFAYRADVNDLADHLLKLLTDDDLRKEMGENAREHAVKNFDYLKVSQDVANLIETKLKL